MTDAPVTSDVNSNARCDGKRAEFLLEVYRQTSGHVGRHITGLWQCVGVVGAALIVLAQDKDTPFSDYACTLAVLLCGWLAATTLDASNWFNRNLAIITNIERLFMSARDLRLVHYFFGKHREAGKHAQHFAIQLWLAAAVCLLVLVYHFTERVLPGFSLPWSNFELSRAIPYLITLIVLGALFWLANHYKTKDELFYRKSPGISL
jgi:hypothetical protein